MSKTNHININKTKGAVFGFVVGDALGVPVEFESREKLMHNPVAEMRWGGTHGQPAGTWSDDTSMTLCVMESLIEKGIDYEDQMKRFEDWLWNASNTAHDEVFDVGIATKSSIFRFAKGTPALACGEQADYSCGNGSLMRMLPMALYIAGKYGNSELDDRAADVIHKSSMCTHAHLRCQMACGIYASVVFKLCDREAGLIKAVKSGVEEALAYYRNKEDFQGVYGDFENLENIELWDEAGISGSGYVLHTLQASLWCLLTTASYEACVLKAVNLGEDTDTTAAVAGSLAGLWYGYEAIPSDWLDALAKKDRICTLCEQFADVWTNPQ